MKRNKLTSIEALRQCKALWMWLEKHPKQTCPSYEAKALWPGWKKLGEYVCNCPCCEWKEQHWARCAVCPLTGFAWKDHCKSNDRPYNPYMKWCNADNNKEQVAAAHQMVLACRRALRSLGVNA
jgi:hypothetical protein